MDWTWLGLHGLRAAHVRVVLTVAAVAACASDRSGAPGETGAPLGDTPGQLAGAGGAGPASAGSMGAAPAAHGCSPPAGFSSAPRTIAESVTWINALPHPVTLACYLESLPRPLAIQATRSVVSAQPADGPRNPRMFLRFDALITSVVPTGVGAALLEFGERRSDTRSLKGELEFPIHGELDVAAAYERLRYDDQLSSCDFCHGAPQPAEDVAIPYAFVSEAILPRPEDRVPLAAVETEAHGCDAAATPERCTMLQALFGREPRAVEAEFPPEYRTFF